MTEQKRREKIAKKMADFDKVYEVYSDREMVEVRGTTGGDMRCIRVYFNADGSVKYMVER